MFEVPRYGEWSGNNYSNGENYGGRVLSEGELRLPGKDLYDNFVAKAHDLNEIFAAEDLRASLVKASRNDAFASLMYKNKLGDYTNEMVYETVGRILPRERFVDMSYYMAQAASSEKDAVEIAFYRYFDHVMRSNMQFSIDYARNGVSLSLSGLVMQVLLFGAPHYFRSEAIKLESVLLEMQVSNRVSRDRLLSSVGDLSDRFVAPNHTNLRSQYLISPTLRFLPTVQPQTIISADISILRDWSNRAIQQKND